MTPLLLLMAWGALGIVVAHKDGAPISACLTMTPGHNSTTAQARSTSPHKLEFSWVQNGTEGSKFVTVKLVSKSDDAEFFKGFFLQARSTQTGEVNPVGKWDVTSSFGLAKGVNCGEVTDSAVTHINNSPKQSLTVQWAPSDDFKGKVVFVATVVKSFDTFWVGIQSDILNLEASANGGSNNANETSIEDKNEPHPLGSAKAMQSHSNHTSKPSSADQFVTQFWILTCILFISLNI